MAGAIAPVTAPTTTAAILAGAAASPKARGNAATLASRKATIEGLFQRIDIARDRLVEIIVSGVRATLAGTLVEAILRTLHRAIIATIGTATVRTRAHASLATVGATTPLGTPIRTTIRAAIRAAIVTPFSATLTRSTLATPLIAVIAARATLWTRAALGAITTISTRLTSATLGLRDPPGRAPGSDHRHRPDDG